MFTTLTILHDLPHVVMETSSYQNLIVYQTQTGYWDLVIKQRHHSHFIFIGIKNTFIIHIQQRAFKCSQF